MSIFNKKEVGPLEINEDWCIEQNKIGQVYLIPGVVGGRIVRVDPPFLKRPESRYSVHSYSEFKKGEVIDKVFATEAEVMAYINELRAGK